MKQSSIHSFRFRFFPVTINPLTRRHGATTDVRARHENWSYGVRFASSRPAKGALNRVAGRPTSTRIAGRKCGSGISRPLALTDGGLPRAAATAAAAAHRRQPKTSFRRRRATATNESGSCRRPTNVLALASVSTSVYGPSSTVRCTCETGSQY